jgi:hypothetical protein
MIFRTRAVKGEPRSEQARACARKTPAKLI